VLCRALNLPALRSSSACIRSPGPNPATMPSEYFVQRGANEERTWIRPARGEACGSTGPLTDCGTQQTVECKCDPARPETAAPARSYRQPCTFPTLRFSRVPRLSQHSKPVAAVPPQASALPNPTNHCGALRLELQVGTRPEAVGIPDFRRVVRAGSSRVPGSADPIILPRCRSIVACKAHLRRSRAAGRIHRRGRFAGSEASGCTYPPPARLRS